MKIAVILCLFALAHDIQCHKKRRVLAFGSYSANGGQVAGLGYNANLGIGYGPSPAGSGQGYGWQGHGSGYYGGYIGLGGYGANSAYPGPGIPPVVNPNAYSPYPQGYPGNGVYGPAIPLDGSSYGYGYGGIGYGGYGNNW